MEAHVREVAAAEFVRSDNVSDEIPLAVEMVVLGDEVAAAGLAVALLHRWNVVSTGDQARVVADLLQRSQNGLVCVLSAACVLLAGACDHRARQRCAD